MLSFSIESYLADVSAGSRNSSLSEDLGNTSGGLEIQSPPLRPSRGVKRRVDDVTSSTSPTPSNSSNDLDDDSLPPEIEKPALSYVALISMAILNNPEKRLLLGDIYKYIIEKFPYYRYAHDRAWKNSIRHNLSLNECFFKNGRSADGKGHFWSIHPACLEDFKKGDFRRRQARRRAQRSQQKPKLEDVKPTAVTGYPSNTYHHGYAEMSSALPTGSSCGYNSPLPHYQTPYFPMNSFMSPVSSSSPSLSSIPSPILPTTPSYFNYRGSGEIALPVTGTPDMASTPPASKRSRFENTTAPPNVSITQMGHYYGNVNSYFHGNQFSAALNVPARHPNFSLTNMSQPSCMFS